MIRRATLAAVAFSLIAADAAAQRPTPPTVPRDRRSPDAPELVERRDPTTAHALAIVPGLGHVYAGVPRRGLAFLAGVVGATVATTLVVVGDCVADIAGTDDCGNTAGLVGTAAILGIWGWNIVDAGQVVRRRNARIPTASLYVAPSRVGVQFSLR